MKRIIYTHSDTHTHRQQINCGWSLDCLIMIYALPLAGVTPPPQDETDERHESILVHHIFHYASILTFPSLSL